MKYLPDNPLMLMALGAIFVMFVLPRILSMLAARRSPKAA